MSKMTLDEAIKHCLEVAGEQQERADSAELIDILDGLDVEACKECAADHRQLAKWLTELKEARRLLKAAVEDNKRVLRENFGDICQFCKHYSNSEAQCRKPHNGSGSWCCENAEWRYAAEALKLLGGSENG